MPTGGMDGAGGRVKRPSVPEGYGTLLRDPPRKVKRKRVISMPKLTGLSPWWEAPELHRGEPVLPYPAVCAQRVCLSIQAVVHSEALMGWQRPTDLNCCCGSQSPVCYLLH